MFNETGCVPGIDKEPMPAESIVPDVKEYISETIDDPQAIYDPEIWDTPGFTLVLSWLAQKWHQKCHMLAHRRSKNPEQYLNKEQRRRTWLLPAAGLAPSCLVAPGPWDRNVLPRSSGLRATHFASGSLTACDLDVVEEAQGLIMVPGSPL
jgi:hypothetical protein